MRILFVTMQYGRSYLQGTERYVATLGRCLRARGHEVAVLAGDPLRVDGRRELGELVDPAERLYALPSRGWMTVQGLGPRRLARWLRQQRPDLVHVANPAHVGVGATAACRQLGIPLVITTNDVWWVCPKATLLRADGTLCGGTRGWAECVKCLAGSHHRRWVRQGACVPDMAAFLPLMVFYTRALLRGMTPLDLLRWAQRNAILSDVLTAADEIIFLSPATSEAIRPRVGHDRCRVIRCGLSAEWFASPRPQPDSARLPEKLTVGYAGAMLAYKGPHLVLEAVRRLGWKQTKIRLAGPEVDSGYMAQLRRLAEGLRVEFVGPVAPGEMPGFLRSLDVLAMPSTCQENMPLIVLEAQAGGVPVVASRLTGVADQIGDERLLFEPGSVEGLAACLTFVAAHPGEVRLGRVNTAEEMTDQTEAVYAEALKRHTEPRP